MITKQQYVEYLICTIGNYTSSNLAEHLDEVSHDVITEYPMNERHTTRGLWELAKRLIQDDPEAFLLVDDSIQILCPLRKLNDKLSFFDNKSNLP